MALSNPFNPPPNTPILPDPQRDSVWRRWFEMLWRRVQTGSLGGTVTSVGLSLPTSVFDVTGSPVTSSGTLAATFDTQSANTAFMGPTSGGAATPAFRALVPADIPAATPLTIGTTPIVSGTVGRVLFEGTGNLLQEDAGLTYDAATDTLTVGAVVSLPDGSAAAPSLKIGDEQNGWYSSGSSELGGTLNGTQYITFSASALTHSGATAGATKSIGITNTSNTANASAAFFAIVGGSSAGDPYSRYTVTGVGSWAAGLDNSDSDSYKISRSTAPGTSDFFTITTSGAVAFNSSFGSSGQVLTSAGSGAPPTWATPTTGTVTSVAQTFTGGLISVSGSPITTSGTLALTVAGTSGGIPYFSSGTTWASSAALAANALVVGGGAGAAPATTTTGTGVITALGVAVGSAGAFVVNGGALGTPSSGTVTNLTGTASININGTVGATTPAAGTFTTLQANGNTTLGDAAADTVTINAETVSQPNIPCFAAYVGTTINNVTGAGTSYTVIYDSERYDQSADFNTTTGTFTASVTGKYDLIAQVRLINIPAGSTSAFISIVTSNATWTTSTGMAFVAGTFTAFPFQISIQADMDAGDTATVVISASAGAGDTADVAGSSSMITFFAGRLSA